MRKLYTTRLRQPLLLVLGTFILTFAGAADAEDQVVSSIYKIVDGTDIVPNESPENFNHDYFFPGAGVNPPSPPYEFIITDDGDNVAFVGCTENLAGTNCETNHFGAYYWNAGTIYQIRTFLSSGGVPLTIAMSGNTTTFLECFVAFGCSFLIGTKDMGTSISKLVASGVGASMVDHPHIAFAFPTDSLATFNVTNDVTTPVADVITAVPSLGLTFSEFGYPDISGQTVVFHGEGIDSQTGGQVTGIYTDEPGGTLRAVAKKNDTVPGGTTFFTDFGEHPAIDNGTIVFVGRDSDAEIGIFRDIGGVLTEIVDLSALGVTSLDQVDVAGGTAAFVDNAGTERLHLWNDGDLTTVVSAGDLLDGKTVSRVLAVRGALANNSIAFPVLFADFTEAIWRAEFAPAAINVGLSVEGVLHPHHVGGGTVPDDTVTAVVHGSSIANGDLFDFFTDDIDPATVRFASNMAAIAPGSIPQFNIDKDLDGDEDVRFLFKMADTGMTCPESSLTLTGETINSDNFEGTDSTLSFNCNAGCH